VKDWRDGGERKPALLLTGGAGFVGSHIANRLAGRWRVIVLDDLSHGSPANLADDSDISIHIGDIRKDADVRAAFALTQVQAVVHCAAQTSVPLSMTDPEFDREVNVAGTARLLAAAREAGVHRFVFMSSGGAIYGETADAATESMLPAPRSYYGLHKHAAEQLVRLSGIPYAILRPSNIYGPRQRSDVDGGVVAIFLERLIAGLPIEVHGDGAQVRDFVYVDDVVAAVEAALRCSGDAVWNVSSGRPTSIHDLIRTLTGLTGITPSVEARPVREGDVRRSLLAREPLAAHIGAATPLLEGLRLTLAAAQQAPAEIPGLAPA
jgi:UDP-glucose 4-epimerase